MEDAQPDGVDGIVERLRAEADRRRAAGVYPPGLEHDLEEHFRRIAAHRTPPDLSDVTARLADLDAAMAFGADRIGAGSQVPGGQALHRVVTKVVARQTQGVLEQVQGFADAVREVLRALTAALTDPGHGHPDLVGQLDAVLERLAAHERRMGELDVAVRGLAERVERLEGAAAGPA